MIFLVATKPIMLKTRDPGINIFLPGESISNTIDTGSAGFARRTKVLKIKTAVSIFEHHDFTLVAGLHSSISDQM